MGKRRLTDAQLDEPMRLEIVAWNGNPHHCAYLNDFRIAGGKPWGGGQVSKAWRGITLRDLIRALPPDTRETLGFDYLGQRP